MDDPVPGRWRLSLEDERQEFHDLSWPDLVRLVRATEAGVVGAGDGEVELQVEFNRTHAEVLYRGTDRTTRRPDFPFRSAGSQDVGVFHCGGCGIRRGPDPEYLARCLDRSDGFRLFEAVLRGPGLPTELPEPQTRQPPLPGMEALAAGVRRIEWRPLRPTYGS